MPAPPLKDNSRSAERARSRPKNQPISPPDPNPKTHFLRKSIPHKPITISAIFNPSIASNGRSPNNAGTLLTKKENKKYKFTSVPLGGLGCGASSPSPVTAPEFIRSAADWEAKKVRKKKHRKTKKTLLQTRFDRSSPDVVEVLPDVCCGPGIAFASDSALVDCVESRRPVAPRTNHRQHNSSTRQNGNLEHAPILDYPSTFSRSQYVSDMSNARQYRHIRRQSPGNLLEIRRFQCDLLPRQGFDGYDDNFGDWRIDVDNMSYEELLALSDRIGYVGTGLGEEEILGCLRKTVESFPLLPSADNDWKCSICQEQYEAADEVGKLNCGHCYHVICIKQWLLQRNTCPVCKAAAAADN